MEKSNWVPTEHPHVFYKEKGDRYDRGEKEVGKEFAKYFPEYTVLITMGPWRSYDMRYEADHEKKVIVLDFYSVRTPTKQMVTESILELAQAISTWKMRRQPYLLVKKEDLDKILKANVLSEEIKFGRNFEVRDLGGEVGEIVFIYAENPSELVKLRAKIISIGIQTFEIQLAPFLFCGVSLEGTKNLSS